MVCNELGKIYDFGFKLKETPELILLGLKLEEVNAKDRTSLWYLTTAARIQYAKFWKMKQIPSLENWITSLVNIVEMDRITKKLRMRPEKEFENDWSKVKKYFENNWAIKNWTKVFVW